jgi:monomeric sarcosine oxidase
MPHYDLLIIGAGAHGSSAAYHAARRGLKVALLEQFTFDHGHGSSHGASRIIRYAYDHPLYIAMARLAFEEWAAVEQAVGEQLMFKTGGLDFGPRGEPVLENMISSLARETITHELLDAAEAARWFPQFRFEDDFAVLYQPDASILTASRCVLAHLHLARQHGAHLAENTRVERLTPAGAAWNVLASSGMYSADRVIVAAGAWANDLLAPLDFQLPLRPVACQENYFELADMRPYQVGQCPVFIAHLTHAHGFPFMPYGLPSIHGSGFKIALHGGPDFDPHAPDRTVNPATAASMVGFASRYLAQPVMAHLSSRVCLYTMTPDEHFIIGPHQYYPNLVVGAACSGHGFKFSNIVGQALVDIALGEQTRFDTALFSPGRFAP